MRYATLASIILLAVTQQVSSQGEKVSFHVTSVEQGDATDYCTTRKCSATRFTVEGYTTPDKDAVVRYVLECVEIIANEPSQKSVTCFRIHAHTDYMVKIYVESVSFGSSSKSDPVVIDYSIKSENEVKKK